MEKAAEWVLKNCKFAQGMFDYPPPYTPTVDEANAREPGIKDAEISWDYGGRDADGEKIYHPFLVITFIEDAGGDFRELHVSGMDYDDVMRRYQNWAAEMGWQPMKPQEKDHYHEQSAEDRNWSQIQQQKAQEKQEVTQERTMEEQLRKITQRPTSKYPEKLV